VAEDRLIGFDELCLVLFQNTYTNAAKLLEAARQLAQSGECNPEEIRKRVDYFEKRVQEFIARVNRRKGLLKLAVNFYSRTQKVNPITG
jgi:kalirin